jgi:hypothetical protein
MYGRLIEFSGADESKRDKAVETMRGTVVPMLREYDGFAGYISLYDPERQRAKALILWESAEAADEAEQTLAERRLKLAGSVGLTVESADLYEVPVAEFEGARV